MDLLIKAVETRETLKEKYGKVFFQDLGWAYPEIAKQKIDLFDLEKATNMQDWREHVRIASLDIHVGGTPLSAALGATEFPIEAELIGKSDSGLAMPAIMCAVSLHNIDRALPRSYMTDAELALLGAIRALRDDSYRTFHQTEQATFKLGSYPINLDDSVLE
jgi:hypothetical protein